MGIGLLLSMIIDQFHIEGVVSFKAKHNPPVGPHGHGPEALPVTL
jgi:hypothetical protein